MSDRREPTAGKERQSGTGLSPGARVWRVARGTAIALTVAYLCVAGYMYTMQRDMVFRPGGTLRDPGQVGLTNVQADQVTLKDGTRLLVWSAPPAREGLPTVLYFHGQGGNLSGRASRFQQIVEQGYGLMAASYRGYPGSEGAPSEQAFIQDGLELFDTLQSAGQTVILHGESLGTGVAAAVAARRPSAELVVLEAPYTGVADIAAAQYPWLPVHFLIKDPFLTRDRISGIAVPVLIVHGTEDRVIPVDHGQALYGKANSPKRIEIIEGAGHNDLWRRGLWELAQNFWSEKHQ